MWKHVRGGILLAALGLIPIGLSATPASAQFFSRGCNNCQRPVNRCNCQSHQQVMQQPVIETQMVPQQVTTYRNEVVTQYRQEAVTQTVPVTTYRDVVVDEGSYQTVYVPKQVAKRIPQVSYQQQVAYRSVPVQTTRQVPQVVTQMVPQQVVRQQPISNQTTQMAPICVTPVTQMAAPIYGGCAPAVAPIAVAPCGPCGGTAYSPAPMYQSVPTFGQLPYGGSVIASNPVTMLAPTSTATSSAAFSSGANPNSSPVPDPKFLDSPGASRESWTTVGSKSARSHDSGSSMADSSGTGGVRFKPARTVYRSWETQSRVSAVDGPERR